MTVRKLDLLYTAYLKNKGISTTTVDNVSGADKISYIDNMGKNHTQENINACYF